MLKVLQARLQQYMNRELPDVQAGFRKRRGTKGQITNICSIKVKAREFQKNICFIDYAKAFDCRPQQTGKFFKRWEYQTTLPASWETCMLVKKQQLELDMEQQIGSKLGKEYVKDIYCHASYLVYIQRTSCKMPSWMNHKLESRFLGETSTTSDMQIHTLMVESEELKSLLMRVKEEREKAVLKLNIQNTKIMASSPIQSHGK